MLYLVNHTESTLGSRHHGDLDPTLSSKGITAIGPIAELFRTRKLDLIVTPSIERNSETAIMLASLTGAHIFVDEGLRTWKQGALSGLPQAKADAAVRVYIRNPKVKVPQGESMDSFLTRYKRTVSKYRGMSDMGKMNIALLVNSLSIGAVKGKFKTVDLAAGGNGEVYEVKSNMELVKL